MIGWILYKHNDELKKQEDYEIRRLTDESEKRGIELKILSPEQIDIIVTRDDRKSILINQILSPLPDFLIPRMGSNTSYFALAVIRQLERLSVFSVNSSQSIDNVKDKLFTLQILAEAGLPIPKTILVKFPVESDIVDKHLQFPVIVKTLSGTHGSGVFLSTDKNSFDDLMQLIYATNKSANIILQEFIESSRGTDLRVLTLGGKVVAAMKRSASGNNFKANFSIGGSVEKYEVTEEIENLSLRISKILNLDFAGIDLLFDENGFKICEVNSSPGFKGIESCCEINIAGLILDFVKEKFQMK